MPNDIKSKIASLEKELYSKDFKPHEVDDSLERKKPSVVAPSWNTEDEAVSLLEEKIKAEKHHKIMKKFLIVSVGFFVLAASVASFVWWRGANIISGENITIDITAPNTVAGGNLLRQSSSLLIIIKWQLIQRYFFLNILRDFIL